MLSRVGFVGRQSIRRNPLAALTAGRSTALAAALREAAQTGLVLDPTRNIYFLGGARYSNITAIPGWSYSRSGSAYDLAGTTLFGANVPRRTAAGLLVEAGATNLLLRSQEFATAWTGGGRTIQSNSATAPDGTMTADGVCANAGSVAVDVAQGPTVANATAHTLSVFLRYNPTMLTPWVELTTTDPGARRSWFNIETGAVGTLGHTASAIETLAGGWVRASVTWTTAATTAFVYLSPRPANGNAGSITGDGVNPQFWAWGAQLETGSVATSYIPTTSSAASRGADVASVALSGFAYPLTLIAEFDRNVDTGGAVTFFAVDDGSNSERSNIGVSSGDLLNVVLVRTSGGSDSVNTTAGAALGVGSIHRGAMRAAINNVVGASNGAIGAADTSILMPLSPTTARFGSNATGGQPYGRARLAAIIPRGLTDADLQAVTA